MGDFATKARIKYLEQERDNDIIQLLFIFEKVDTIVYLLKRYVIHRSHIYSVA